MSSQHHVSSPAGRGTPATPCGFLEERLAQQPERGSTRGQQEKKGHGDNEISIFQKRCQKDVEDLFCRHFEEREAGEPAILPGHTVREPGANTEIARLHHPTRELITLTPEASQSYLPANPRPIGY